MLSTIGLLEQGALAAGFHQDRLRLFSDPEHAWREALDWARPGRLVVLLSPRPEQTLQLLAELDT